jgi:hypothetical protein
MSTFTWRNFTILPGDDEHFLCYSLEPALATTLHNTKAAVMNQEHVVNYSSIDLDGFPQ